MEKQKKIALINDLTGFGRCSTAVMAPIVSALKIQAVAVPTAILYLVSFLFSTVQIYHMLKVKIFYFLF